LLNGWFWSAVATTGLALFFALTHQALSRFSRARLEAALRRRGRLQDLRRLFRHHEDLVRTTGLLHVVCLIVMTVLVEFWAHDGFGGALLGWTVGTALAAGAAVTLGAVIPMAWARYAAESILVVTLPVCQLCRVLFSPAWLVLGVLDSLVRRLAGAPPGKRRISHIEEEIRSVVSEGEREGAIAEAQKDMIESVIAFSKSVASQIMTPRTDIIGIEAGAAVEQARTLIATSGHSRIPVTRGNIDTIVGILYAKDVLARGCDPGVEQTRVKDVMRPPQFVPETKKLDELLADFQGDKVHMAIVLDEYGGTAGLVTIEDVVEEIVGEIIDEYEQEPQKPIRAVAERSFEVEARAHIDQLNAELSLNLPKDAEYETIGGFVLSRLGYIPKTGDVLEYEGLRITVLAAEPRRITRLRIDLAKPAEAPQGS